MEYKKSELKSCAISASVRQQKKAPTTDPAEVPEMMDGRMPSSYNDFITPKCCCPIAPPPERHMAVRP